MFKNKLAALSGWWRKKSESEQKRLKSFIPLFLYTIGFLYFIVYLSILNTVNRGKTGDSVKNWFGGDPPWVMEQNKIREDIENSFTKTRKRVSGGR